MIPFLDLKAQYRQIKDEVRIALDQAMENAWFVLGPQVQAFEEKFAAYVNAQHAVAVNSGTSALHLAMLASGIGPGDEVIVPAMTFIATASAVEYAGARPVFVDVDARRYTMAPELIERAITRRTKAIVPVHLYGQPADMDPILAVARKHGLIVIEDAAQAHGAEYRGKRCGSIGHLACFSFYPGKNLGAYGEGGIVTTDREDYAKTVRALRDWGQHEKGRHSLRGFNYRMEGFQGAVLGVKLNHIETWTEARRGRARLYDELLRQNGIEPPEAMPDVRHVYHIYPVMLPNRDAVRKALADNGIQANIHYPSPVHLQECFADLGHKPGDFPNAERIAREELSLPIYAEMTDEQVAEVVGGIRGQVGA